MDFSATERILHASDNSVTLKIAGQVARGASFHSIMQKYDLDPTKEAQIHEFKSRIQELLREGIPIETAVRKVFKDKKIISEILKGIKEHKANRDALKGES